jgi:hypothetical protein
MTFTVIVPGTFTPAVTTVHTAHHVGRKGVEGALLLGAEYGVEGFDRRGVPLELGLPPGDVFRHHRRHPVEALGRGQLGEVVMTIGAVATRTTGSLMALTVAADVVHVHGRRERGQQGVESPILVGAKLQRVMQAPGVHFHMLVHARLELRLPGGALFGARRTTGRRRRLRQGERGDRSEGGGGDQASDGAGQCSHLKDIQVVELTRGCAWCCCACIASVRPVLRMQDRLEANGYEVRHSPARARHRLKTSVIL